MLIQGVGGLFPVRTYPHAKSKIMTDMVGPLALNGSNSAEHICLCENETKRILIMIDDLLPFLGW